MNTKKKTNQQITVEDMFLRNINFLHNENKVEKIYEYLKNWIILSLECGKINVNDLLPSKLDIACSIGVSQGTIQSAYRLLEDNGYVESKQKIGTYIKDNKNSNNKKLTSKLELTIEILKNYIKENKYQKGDKLISIRKIAKQLNISNTTLRTAVINLVTKGYLAKDFESFVVLKVDSEIKTLQKETLVEKTAKNIKQYINNNPNNTNKLPPNIELAKMYNVSIKTIHDSIKILTKEGYVYTRRGKYGTTINNNKKKSSNNLYIYEKIEQKIKKYIIEKCQMGDKLPSIKNFALMFLTSEKTVKKALNNLADDGFITFTRGRYGGTFVMDIPENQGESYKWLAINSDYLTK